MAAPAVLSNWYSAEIKKDQPMLTSQNGLLTSANTNVSHAPVATTNVSPATYDPSKLGEANKWNVTDNQTVQGQLNNILSSGSPLMKQAETTGLQQANNRGLLNSSIAAGAAQNAMIANATPIATADADVHSRSAGYNAETSNKFSIANVDAENAAKNFGAQAINRANEFNSTQAFTKQQDLFQANVKASLDQINNEMEMDKQSQAVYGTLSKGFADAMLEINKDTNMNQASKDYSIRQLFKTYKAQISMLSAIGSIPDISKLLIDTSPPPSKNPPPTKPQGIPTWQDVGARKAHYSPKDGKIIWN